MYRTQGFWYAGYFQIYYDKEQEKHSGQTGIEKVQSNPEKDDLTS